MAECQLQSSDLVDRVADWGVTVSEARAKKGPRAHIMAISAYLLVFAGAVLLLPIAAGFFLNFESQGLFGEFAVVAIIAAIGITLKISASRLPRNALQIDYSAGEIRLGSERPDGVFVRQRVTNFRDIGGIRVEDDGSLSMDLGGETVTLRFNEAETGSLHRLAAQIAAARESALRAPIRSRIRSRIMGIEAGVREVKSRLTSRIA